MVTTSENAIPWTVAALRLTLFPAPSAAIDASSWWTDVVGEDPESEVSNPRAGHRSYDGSWSDGRLALSMKADRIDWRLSVREDPHDLFAGLGPLDSVGNKFRELMNRWFALPSCPTALRVAFGAILHHPVLTREAGYRLFSNLLPLKIDPVGSTDLLYQINRPRASNAGLAGLRVNRLAKWVVAIGTLATLVPELTGVKSTPLTTKFACNLELDMNTSPDFQEVIARDSLPAVFEELVRFGGEIAQLGDTP